MLLDLLVCPRCRGRLSPGNRGLTCEDCARRYPALDGMPVLFDDPSARIEEWERQVGDFRKSNADVRAKILAQLAGEPILARTRRRLDLLHARLEEHGDRLLDLSSAAGLGLRERSGPVPSAVVPGEGTLTAYYHQLHRDWGWDGTDNREAIDMLEEVSGVLGDTPLGRTLVLGAGGCRLPYDLHRVHGGTTTIAIDINPLPFVVARRVIKGETVRLFEFPLRPRHTERSCIDRTLGCSNPGAVGFELVFGDGLDPPVRPGAFDTVLTPWFIDQIPKDAADLMPVLREVLAPGGRWLNFGPLIYHPSHTRLAHRYCVDEILELAQAWGFEVERHTYRRMTYMESPDGTQGRTEHVLVSLARKRDAEPKARLGAEPSESWLLDPGQPVPRFRGLDSYRPPHPMFAAVVALIDGERSTARIAEILVEQHGLPPEAATMGVQACLREIHRALDSA